LLKGDHRERSLTTQPAADTVSTKQTAWRLLS
jgi:hypothetical protein